MTTGMFRSLVLSRAMGVEPIARALCVDPIEAGTTPFSRKGDRWRSAAQRAAQSTWATAAHEPAGRADDPELP